jgi:hypothetical protein
MSLQTALVDMRRELAANIFGPHTFLTPQCIMSTKLLDCIVDLAHNQKITNITTLCELVTWGYLDTHGTVILQLVKQFCPPTDPSPFTTVLLQSRAQATAGSSSNKPSADTPKKRNCRICGIPGHYGT